MPKIAFAAVALTSMVLRTFSFASLLVVMTAAWNTPPVAAADRTCLPQGLFAKDADAQLPKFNFGWAAGKPTLCAPHVEMSADQPWLPAKPGYLGCWTVDPSNGAVAPSTAVAISGRSRRLLADGKGCVDGYCLPEAKPDEQLLSSTSTDNGRVVILGNRALHVFDADTRKETQIIPLSADDGPENSNVGNEPIDLLFIGHVIYVVGADAGPYTAVWGFRDDGQRLGIIRSEKMSSEDFGGFSVYNGAANIVDDGHILLGSLGLKSLILVDVATGARLEQQRAADLSACSPEDMASVVVGNYESRETGSVVGVSGGCHDAVVRDLEPYFDAEPIRVPTEDFLVALSGKNRGSLALLDAKTLAEKQRYELPRCSK